MANPYYDPGNQRADKVNILFDTIAARYDLINDLQSLGLHRGWKRRLSQLAQAGPGQRILDLCCGTGDVTLALARGGADVIGVDFSAPMLAVAHQRAVRAGIRGVSFIRADALRTPFANDSFAAVTVSYGLRNLADFEGGLREMKRVAKPGGRLVVLDFGKPAHRAWRTVYYAYLRWLVPALGRLFCGQSDAYGYILESLQRYPAQSGVAATMQAMNCSQVRVINFLGGAMSINYGEKGKAGSGKREA